MLRKILRRTISSLRAAPPGRARAKLGDALAAATAVQESEERFRSLAENASDAIVTIDAHDRIVFANRAVEKLFGYTAGELADIPFTALMPERFRDRHRAGVSRHIATGERRIRWDGVELPGLHKSGHEVPLEITFGEYQREGEHFFSGIMRDVTERKRIEEERERVVRGERSAKELAERAVHAREQILGIVAHDLRSPLNAISSAARLLQMLPPEKRRDEEADLLQAIVRSADRMDRLISDLLDVSRIEAGRFSLVRESVDPSRLVEEICRILAPRAREKSIEIRCETPERSPPISADGDRLLQVLENLVGNAVKFTPEGGRITVGAEVEEAEVVRFRVRDTGPGIPPDDLERVFDAYWHHAERSDGAGLGLFISTGIVEAHGGRIWAESEPGEGSTFRFTIPVAGDEAPPSP